MYIRQKDYENYLNAHDWKILSDFQNAGVVNISTLAACEEAKSYLRMRYDVGEEFRDIKVWNNSDTYNEGDRVEATDGTLHIALISNTNSDPLTNPTTDWEMADDRNPQLLLFVISMAVYTMYSKIPNRVTPEDVNNRYLDARDWLRGVAEGKYVPDIAVIEDETQETTLPKFGGLEKQNNNW